MRSHWAICFVLVAGWSGIRGTAGAAEATAADSEKAEIENLDQQFESAVLPFLQTYCVECHSSDEPQADLDLSLYVTPADVIARAVHLDALLERLKAGDMPPPDAPSQPSADERRQAVAWLQALRDRETSRNAGDPGVVLARRLSNAEYNYTIRDLTGVDIQPTREFPVDPANTAGFDNSGESLAMSPSLLTKYLQAARNVADHMFLRPEGFAFAPHPMLAETDRDKYCVHRIIDFYHQHNTDYADYFEAAWRFKHRAALGIPEATLRDAASDRRVSAKYLETIWSTLEGAEEQVGPLAKLQTMWRELPAPVDGASPARDGCDEMRDYVVRLRRKVELRFLNITAGSMSAASQPFLIWKNVQYATHRRQFDPAQLQVEGETPPAPPTRREVGADGDFGPGRTRLVKNKPGDPDLAVPAGQRARYEAAFAKFCSVFPDKFYMQERGRNYFDTRQDRGRYLSAGFHSLMGYFRDDQPLYELLLDESQQKELDAMWFELDFIASANERMFTEFYAGGSRQSGGGDDDEGPEPVDGVVTSEATIRQLEAALLKRATTPDDGRRRRRYRRDDDDDDEPPRDPQDEAIGVQAIKDYFNWINGSIRRVERARIEAEPSHLDALLTFAARAYRRPLTDAEQQDLLAFYRAAREQDGLAHEAAVRECIVAVLMAPDFCYRIDLVPAAAGVHPLSDYDLASRLSYFLWASAPDDELLARAAAGDLHEPEVMVAQARRMMKDPRVRALAVEFGGNWLDFRRFEELNTVDRDRFAAFDDELRAAMFEEPVRLLLDVFQKNRPVLDLLYGDDTFANAALAEHYGMPEPAGSGDGWVHVDGAARYGRG
ncbi:MAG TPA: DUF1592 domain-containing protein, partial [Lacipirellulaceae bacterium]|nr:DUF1592 domain-containing protein [Lacipirellulaceae bacterium]